MAQDAPRAQPPSSLPNPIPPATSTTVTARACTTAKRTSKGSAVSESTKASTAALSERNRFSGDSQLQWRAVRTVPTWVQRYEDEGELVDQGPVLPPPTHKSPQKSIWDNRRENTPVTPRPSAGDGSRWKSFAEHSSGRPFTSASERKDLESGAIWGDDGLSAPWLATNGEGGGDDQEENAKKEIFGISAKRREIWYKRFHLVLLNNPMVPLTFRAIIWILSLFALSFSSSIYVLSRKNGTPQLPSTVLAIVVDAVALVYLIYITYDEYSGQPLGLRSAKAKIRLIMLDLVFIIFASANLSLAFDTLYDVQQSCSALPGSPDRDTSDYASRFFTNEPICSRQRALASFLFLALCAWVSTFTVSIFRLVERVSRTNA